MQMGHGFGFSTWKIASLDYKVPIVKAPLKASSHPVVAGYTKMSLTIRILK